MTGTIFDIKEMALHDGPGIRTTVFLKGCPLRCKWCHNPEGLSTKPQLMYKKVRCIGCGECLKECNHGDREQFGRCIYRCPENCLEISGKTVDAGELAKKLIKNSEMLGDSFGGFTFSGGEPLMQPEFLLDLAGNLEGYHLCLETSGYASEVIFKRVTECVDLVIMDIKIADCDLHREYTGVGNELILKNFELLKKEGKPHVVRTPLIPGITDTEENLSKIKCIVEESSWEKLPYNNMAGAKYEMLNMQYPMDGIMKR